MSRKRKKKKQKNIEKETVKVKSPDFIRKFIIPHLAIILIILVSLIIRIWFFYNTTFPELASDSQTYSRMAQNIAFNGTFSNMAPSTPDPEPTAFVVPGYPFFLAIFYWIKGKGADIFNTVRFIQLMLSLLMVFCAYRIGCELKGKTFGVFAAIITSVYPGTFFTAVHILTEFMASMLAVVFWCLILRAQRRDRYRDYLFAGIVFTMSVFTRPPLLPLIFAIPVYLFLIRFRWEWKRNLFRCGWFFIPLTLVMGIWITRNAIHFGHFIPLTTASHGAKVVGLRYGGKYQDLWPEKGLSEYEYNQMWKEWSDELLQGRLEKGYLHFCRTQMIPHFQRFVCDPFGIRVAEGWACLSWQEAKAYFHLHRYLIWFSLVGLILLSFHTSRVFLFWVYLLYHPFVHVFYKSTARYGYPWSVIFFLFAGYALAGLYKIGYQLFKDKKWKALGVLLFTIVIYFYLLHHRRGLFGSNFLWWIAFIVDASGFIFLVRHLLPPLNKISFKQTATLALVSIVALFNILGNTGSFQVWKLYSDKIHSWGYLYSKKDYIEHIMEIPEWVEEYDKFNLFMKVMRGSSKKPEYNLEVFVNKKLVKVIKPEDRIPKESLRIPLDPNLVKNSERLHILLHLSGKVDVHDNYLLVRLRLNQFRGKSLFRGQNEDLSYRPGPQNGTFQIYLEAVREIDGEKEVRKWIGNPR